jgi:basic membrane protein A
MRVGGVALGRRRLAGLGLTLLLAAGAVVRGPGEAASPEPGRKRIAVVLSVGGLGDRSFNDMAHAGLIRAREELGVVGVYGEPAQMSEDERYLEFYAEQGFDLVFAIGFLMKSSLEKVAARYPETRFAILDEEVDRPNVASVRFREHEGSYLVGALAGRKSRTGKAGIVMGLDIPLLRAFAHGYRQGFLAERPGGEVLEMVAGSFADPVRGKELTRTLVQQGADVVYQAAGQTGNGVIAGAREAGVFAIGVDANQNPLAPGTVLTSMLKQVDVAVFEQCRAVVEERFRPGLVMLGVREGGVGWALDEHNRALVSEEDERHIRELERRIAAGELVVEARAGERDE